MSLTQKIMPTPKRIQWVGGSDKGSVWGTGTHSPQTYSLVDGEPFGATSSVPTICWLKPCHFGVWDVVFLLEDGAKEVNFTSFHWCVKPCQLWMQVPETKPTEWTTIWIDAHILSGHTVLKIYLIPSGND